MNPPAPSPSTVIEKLRGALFYGHMAAMTVIFGVVCLPAVLFGTEAAGRCIRVWAKSVMAGVRIICGVRTQIVGAERLPTGPAIIACNHQSMWETVALYALLPKAAIIFKQELLRIPIYGWWGLRAGNIVVDRSAGAKAIRAVTRAARDRLARGAQIVIFPEGTRARPGTMGSLQPGVAGLYAACALPVIPVAHNSGRHWLYPGLAKRPGRVRLVFGEPIMPGTDRRTFLRQLDTALRDGLARAEGGCADAALHAGGGVENPMPSNQQAVTHKP